MIIYDYSFQYHIKPFNVITDPLEIRDFIYDTTAVEIIRNTSIRILLTVNSEEMVIHYPSDVADHILDDVEKELRSIHEKMSLFIADTIITLDILVSENVDSSDQSRKLIIIDLISFNGVDYRATELRTRRRLTKTFFQGFISSPNLTISELINVYNSQHELDSSNDKDKGITRQELFGTYRSESNGKKWVEILIRDETSSYTDENKDEWSLIDLQQIPDDIRALL
ncbi:MAG: hypothetical protein GPJ54_17355 [Candidatus Heimdallarchaeota archaeon]|nr:hypothetical protein [Candidatus Heimdallarchaeota archaeon]